MASKFVTCVWFAFVTVTLVTYTAGLVNNLYWASMVHRPASSTQRYMDLAHVVSSRDVKYGTTVDSQTYLCVRVSVAYAVNHTELYYKKYYTVSQKNKTPNSGP